MINIFKQILRKKIFNIRLSSFIDSNVFKWKIINKNIIPKIQDQLCHILNFNAWCLKRCSLENSLLSWKSFLLVVSFFSVTFILRSYLLMVFYPKKIFLK
jgi:hypothetical protein